MHYAAAFIIAVVCTVIIVVGCLGFARSSVADYQQDIISQCESAGYYNFKQTRILCSVEKVK